MRRILGISFSILALAAGATDVNTDKLIPCPDCGKSVSKHALMCPTCGCDGKVIADAVKKIEEMPKPKIPDRLVRADFGRNKCDALPVHMSDGRFVVLPVEKMLDVKTLVFTFVSTNLTIDYGIPEIALNRPIIRFPITETNLLFAAADTNICSTLSTPTRASLSEVSGWQQIQPRALKSQGKILLRIKAGEKVELPSDAHPFYKELAKIWSKREE